MTPLPIDFPPLRVEAERLARELLSVMDYAFSDEEACDTVESYAILLADLTRPASRDHWARWLADRVGLVCGATAPVLEQRTGHGHQWAIRTPTGSAWFGDLAVFEGQYPMDFTAESYGNPAEALRLAILHVAKEAPRGN